MSITNSMFESIRGALAASNSENSGPANILKTEPGNTYTVRLLPFKEDPSKTFFHYVQVGWSSFATGQYTGIISPTSFGERDPVMETRYKLYRGDDNEKEMAKKILRSDKWLVNVYVVNDPVTPDNNGSVMVLRYGKQLQKIITNAIDGEDAAELGPRVFDLSETGCNLKIVVEKQGDFPTYVSSKFSFPSAIPGMDDQKAEEVLGNTVALDTIFKVKSFDELKKIANEHILCVDEAEEEDTPTPTPTAKKTKPKSKQVEDDNGDSEPSTPNDDAEIKDLLADLDL